MHHADLTGLIHSQKLGMMHQCSVGMCVCRTMTLKAAGGPYRVSTAAAPIHAGVQGHQVSCTSIAACVDPGAGMYIVYVELHQEEEAPHTHHTGVQHRRHFVCGFRKFEG